MAERKINIPVMTYRGVDDDAVGRFGVYGETVDVHGDYLATFDQYNVDTRSVREDAPTDREGDGIADVPSDLEEVKEPSRGASTEAWQEFARSVGATDADLAGKSRADLIEQYGTEESK